MCKYSLESYTSRDAVQGETLTANVHYSGHGGTLGPDKHSFACVAHGQKLTVENIQFKDNVKFFKHNGPDDVPRDRHFCRSLVNANTSLYINKLSNKRHVVTLLDGEKIDAGYDFIEFENGLVMMLAYVVPGTEFYVGVKPTLEDKLGLDEVSLRAVAADDPDPKPEDEKKDDEEKKDEPLPDTPASVRALYNVLAPIYR